VKETQKVQTTKDEKGMRQPEDLARPEERRWNGNMKERLLRRKKHDFRSNGTEGFALAMSEEELVSLQKERISWGHLRL